MIKTLRLTSILTAAVAICLLVFPAVFGARSGQKEDFVLNFENALEKFKKSKDNKSGESRSEVSPLVKQAEAFALYLNPPAASAPETPKTRRHKPTVKSRPVNVSVKFTLIGTSCFASSPALSLALIDEPGKGLRWIRQGGGIGHLIIERIEDGCIFLKDGGRSVKLVAERPKKISLVKGQSSSQSTSDKDASIIITVPEEMVDASQTEDGKWATEPVEMSEQERQAQLKGMFAELMALQTGEGRQDDVNSEPEDMRISQQEQEELEHVGEKLKSRHRVPPPEVEKRGNPRIPPQHRPPWANR